MKTEIIRSISLFTDLPDSLIDELADSFKEFHYRPGEVLIREGSAPEHFFIILDGEVDIIKSLGTPDERVVAVSGKGAMLGEMSLFSHTGAHTASVTARTPVDLLEMSHSRLDALLRSSPELSYRVVRLFSRRLEESENLTIIELREKNRQLTQAYQELKAAQAQMIEKERMERELEIASEFQRSILPQRLPKPQGYEIGALMEPARFVGGDFYDFIPLDNHRLGIVVGDVCDKGVPAALLMTLAYSAMRTWAVRSATPGQTLQAVNRHLLGLNLAATYVTLVYGVLDIRTHQFTYARAGHPHPLLLDEHNRPVTLPQGNGLPVGLFSTLPLDEQTISMPPGSLLLVFSDGLAEALEARHSNLTLENVCSSLLEGHEMSAQDLCSGLWGIMTASGKATMIQDDFTVIAVRRLPA